MADYQVMFAEKYKNISDIFGPIHANIAKVKSQQEKIKRKYNTVGTKVRKWENIFVKICSKVASVVEIS